MPGIEYDFLFCPRCEQHQHRDMFNVDRSKFSGRTSLCRKCRRESRRKDAEKKTFMPDIENEFCGIKEAWLPYASSEKIRYEVSSYGRIRSFGRCGTRLLKRAKNRAYRQVTICINGRRAAVCVHRVVAEAFLQRPEWGEDVHHINHDPSDNRLVNLCWVTKSQNQFYRREFEREQKTAELTGRVVEPAPLVCSLFLAGIGSPEEDGSPSSCGGGEQEQVPRPEVLPESVREVPWCIPFRQDLRFDPRPEHGYTTNSQVGVGPRELRSRVAGFCEE